MCSGFVLKEKESQRQAFVAGIAAHHGKRLRRFLAARLRDTSQAPDLAQEVYLRLLRVGQHDLIRNPEAYLFAVASHLLHEQRLRRAAAPIVVEIDDVFADLHTAAEDDPMLQAETQQRVRELERVIGKLSPKAQAALILHRRDGYSLEEIGEQLGVSRPMAKKYLAKALVHCRRWLERNGKAEGP